MECMVSGFVHKRGFQLSGLAAQSTGKSFCHHYILRKDPHRAGGDLRRPVQCLTYHSVPFCATFLCGIIYNPLRSHSHPTLQICVHIFISGIIHISFMFLLLETKSGHITDAQEMLKGTIQLNEEITVSMCTLVLQNWLSFEAGHKHMSWIINGCASLC